MTAIARAVERKHERIVAALEAEIRTGLVKRGAQLPGEVALARRFQVSRNTVRSALAELCRAGLIATRTGKGSFVLFDGRPLDARHGWAHALAAQGVDTVVRVLRLELMNDPTLAAEQGLDRPDVIVVERVRELTTGEAISYEHSTIPVVDGIADLPRRGLTEGSLTETLRSLGLFADRGEQRVCGHRLDEREAQLLHRQAGEWFLSLRRTTWTAAGTFVEQVRSLLDPAHFELRVDFDELGS